jgi:cytochrome P450
MPDLIELFGGHFMSPVPDPYPAYARLRRETPVLQMELPMGPASAYLVTRYEDCVAVLRDPALFSSKINAQGIGLVMGRTILEMDGKEHGRHRNLISPFFVPKALTGEMPNLVQSIADQLVDRIAGEKRADLVAAFTLTFPLRIIAHIIGLPIEDYETFQKWALAIIGFSDDPEAGFAAAQSLVEHLKPIAEERKREPRDDLLSKLVHAEVDGHRLEDEEVFSFLRLLVPAGAETTYRLIGNTLFGLLTHPAELEEVRGDRSLLDAAIEEALRWEAPVCFAARNTTAPTQIAGVEIPKGAGVLVGISSANRDERHYADPDRFDLHRGDDEHVAFGFGRHYCAGSHLARLEAKVAIDTMLDGLPGLRLEPGAACGVLGLAFRSPDRLPVVWG